MIQLNTSQPSVQRKGEGEENLHPLNPVCNKSNNTSRSCFTLQCCAICTSLCLFASFLRTCFANVTAVPQKTRASDFLLSSKSKQTNKRKCIFKAITNMDKKEKKLKFSVMEQTKRMFSSETFYCTEKKRELFLPDIKILNTLLVKENTI